MDTISINGLRFSDECGRERIFSGINCVDKGKISIIHHDKRIYEQPLDPKYIPRLKELGFNLVRLGITWDAAEPSPGQYNDRYLDKVAAIGRELEKHGIYFYLDMHQDLYGPKTGGDGAPAWATLTDGAKKERRWFVWAEPYFAGKAVHNAFVHFWNNDEVQGRGLWAHYLDMWKYVIAKFEGNTALIGYDFLNEPFPGQCGSEVFALLLERGAELLHETDGTEALPMGILSLLRQGQRKGLRKSVFALLRAVGSARRAKLFLQILGTKQGFSAIGMAAAEEIRRFDLECYTPFIRYMAAGVRELTDKGIFFLENSYYSNLGIPYCAEPIEYDGVREQQQAFAPHGYDLLVDSPLYKYASAARTDVIFEQHALSQQRLQMPVLVGEWGGSSKGTKWHAHLSHLIADFERNRWSNTYWCFSKKLLENPSMQILSRPYPQAVCGEIETTHFDREQNVYTLTFRQDRAFGVPTEVYLPRPYKSVSADGKYETKPLGNGCMLYLYTEPGKHTLRVEF